MPRIGERMYHRVREAHAAIRPESADRRRNPVSPQQISMGTLRNRSKPVLYAMDDVRTPRSPGFSGMSCTKRCTAIRFAQVSYGAR